MRFHDVFDNGKPQPQPGEFPSRTAVGLPKAVKDAGQQVRTDSLSVVAHLDLDTGLLAAQRDVDLSSLGRELDGIRDQVPHDLLDAHAVTQAVACRRIKLHVNVMPRASAAGRTTLTPALITSASSQGRMSTRSLPETMRDTSRTSSMSCTCALVLRSMTFESLLKMSRFGVFVAQDAEPPDDGVQRRAHLVAQRGQKHVLGAVGRFGFPPRCLFASQQRLAVALDLLRISCERRG